MKVLLEYNPAAGHGHASAEILRSAFVEAGFTVSLQRQGEVAAGDETAPPDLVVVAGGDGSVAHAVDRWHGRARLFSIVPFGTANNIATSLGIRGTPAEIARGLWRGEEHVLDIGRVDGLEEPHRFLEAAGVGVLAASLAENKGTAASGEEKLRAGRESLARRLRDAPPLRLRASVDGAQLPDDLILLEALNMPVSGSRLRLAPSAEPGDGLLDVGLLRQGDSADAIGALEADPEGPLPLEIVRGRRVELTWTDQALRFDDQFPALPDAPRSLTITLSDAPLRVLVPARTGG